MANTVTVISNDQDITQKVHTACQKLQADMRHFVELEEAEEVFTARLPGTI